MSHQMVPMVFKLITGLRGAYSRCQLKFSCLAFPRQKQILAIWPWVKTRIPCLTRKVVRYMVDQGSSFRTPKNEAFLVRKSLEASLRTDPKAPYALTNQFEESMSALDNTRTHKTQFRDPRIPKIC